MFMIATIQRMLSVIPSHFGIAPTPRMGKVK